MTPLDETWGPRSGSGGSRSELTDTGVSVFVAKWCRMGRWGFVALALLLALPATPAKARISTPPRPMLIDHLPTSGVRTMPLDDPAASPLDQPNELIASSGPAGDITTYARAERRLLERTWGPLTSLLEAEAQVDESAESAAPDGRIRVPIASSDLNGDHNEDVVFFDIAIDANSFRTGVHLTSLDGTSGKPLWSRDFGNPYDLMVLSPSDVTGDGADDLLVVVMERAWQPNDIVCQRPVVCTYDDLIEYRWTIELLSGPDASTTWDRSVDGSIRYTGGYAGQGPGLTVARHDEAVDALIDIRSSPDIDGDNQGDFTLNFLGYSGELVFSQFVSKEDFAYTTTAAAIAGDTGETLISKSLEDQPGAALLTPAGHVTDDGRGDLLWTVPTERSTPRACAGTVGCAQVRLFQLHAELVDGKTGSLAWEADVEDTGLVGAASTLTNRDLTGDGSADVVLGLTFDDGSSRALALSGTDGSHAWSLDTLLTDPPSAVGSVDGGPGSDVLFWEGWYPSEGEAPGVTFRIRLRRVDGTTGQVLLTTQHDLVEQPDKIGTIFAYPAGDADADGIDDIALATWHYSGWWIENGSAATVLTIESGKSGSAIVALGRDRKALLFPGGDWVAGGPLDMFEGSTPHNDLNFSLSAIEMPTGNTLWTRQDIAFTALFGAVRNQDGAGDDVVYGRTQIINEAPRRKSRIDLLDGFSGVRLWGNGPQLDN